MKKLFVAGTDTGVGKTVITCALLQALQQHGVKAAGLKPVASDSHITTEGTRNEDGLLLKKFSGEDQLAYDVHNPLRYIEAISPHIAARNKNDNLSVNKILEACTPMFNSNNEVVLIEGVGGWHVPLNHAETMQDLVQALACPVILVVGLRLGCLNHSLLTYNAIINAGLPLFGWVANTPQAEKMQAKQENIDTLRHWINAPCLGVLDFQTPVNPRQLAQQLNITYILENSVAPSSQQC